MTPPWTVGIVNYRSAVYLAWQLRILYEANPPRSFRLVIVDNSRPPERTELERLTAPYRQRYGNVELVFHEPQPGPASMQHGEGLELVRLRTDTPLLLVQDPDFFWVRYGHLTLLANLLGRGNLAVGAPYPKKVGLGDPWFPAAFGAAYRTEAVRRLSFAARVSPESIAESFARWPIDEHGFTFDVGWQIRDALSDRPHYAFEQRIPENLGVRFGEHSFEWVAREYLHEGRPIAVHLFRGTFTGTWTTEFADPEQAVPQAWQEARDRLGAHFHALVMKDCRLLARLGRRWLSRVGALARREA